MDAVILPAVKAVTCFAHDGSRTSRNPIPLHLPCSSLRRIQATFLEMERGSLWQLGVKNDETKYKDVYNLYPSLVSLRIHHGGVFSKFPGRQYLRGKTQFVHLVDTDKFSVNELHVMMAEIGYEASIPTYFHFKFPGKDLDVGLHALGSDADVIEMLKFVPNCRHFEIYTEQWETRLNTYYMIPGGSKVVIEELPDSSSPEMDTGLHSSCKLLGWIDKEKGNEVDDMIQKDETVEDILHEIKNHDVFDDFDPFFGEGYNDMEKNVGSDKSDEHESKRDDGSDDEFVVEAQNVVDEVEVDMKTFMENINVDVEWIGKKDVNIDDSNLSGDVDAVDMEDLESNTDDSDMEKERKMLLKKLRKEKASASKEESSCFFVGQVFGSKDGIKRLIDLHAIESKRQLHVIKNDSMRIRVVCRGSQQKKNRKSRGGPSKPSGKDKVTEKEKSSGKGKAKEEEVKTSGKPCPWVLYISKGKNDATWMVKTLKKEHTCFQSREVKACTASFLSQEIVETISHNPEIPIKALNVEMERKFGQKFSHMKSFRAKTMALDKVRGNYAEQYNHLRDYVLELQRVMPETTVKLDVEHEPNIQFNTRKFKRIYVCFGPLKKGFKAGQRDFLGLDGAFMKGPFPGQILTAVGIDPNNGTYPLAYAIVESETMRSWTWFLECIAEDLDLHALSNFTFISDRQKGIIPAIVEVFPCAEHRFCLRHIHENMKKSWKGKEFKDHLWKCAVASTVQEFDKAMSDLKALSPPAYEWLKQIPPHHWSRSHFTGRSHTDCLLNNICEVFNKQLVDARDKPIITAMEYIREYLMKRITNVKKVIEKANGILTPTATKVLAAIKEEAKNYNVLWDGASKYHVTGPWLDQCVVDVKEKVCTCRRWELIGIPCKHAVATIWNMAKHGEQDDGIPEYWCHHTYFLDTWKEMYAFNLEPINGPNMWPKSNCPMKLTPPIHHTQVGRPKKKRRKSISEITKDDGKKLTRAGKTVTCESCKQQGHNKRTCKGQAP